MLDKIIKGIESQVKSRNIINIIVNSIGHLVVLETNHDYVVSLCKISCDLEQNKLEVVIRLIKLIDSDPIGENYDEWIE